MKGGLKNQRTQNSRLLTLEPDTESIGILTPVHVEDIVKDRNLDYLQTLGELVQKMHATPVWYEYQTNQNKMKFLEIYQLAINYARNTEAIYTGILNEFQDEFENKKQKVKKLKSEILSHKEKTLKLRKHYRKEKLNKEKQKVLNYEKNIKILRDDMLRQKRELEEKNERLFNQERLRQQSKLQNQSYGAPFGYLHNQGGMAFPPQTYPPQAYPPQAYPPYAYPPYPQPNYQFMNVPPPASNTQIPFLNLFQANSTNQPQFSTHQNHAQNKKKPSREQNNTQKNEHIIYNTKKNSNKNINEQEVIQLTNSFIEQVQIKNLKPQEKKQQLKISEARSEALKNTDKSYSFKQSNNVRSSNIQSQNNDEVKQLYPNSLMEKKSGLQARLSNKSIDYFENDLNSIMDIQLKTQSKNDLENNLNRPLGKRTSINDEIIEQPKSQIINPKSNIKKKNSPQITKKQQKPSVKFKQQEKEKEKSNSFDGNFSIKITKAKEVKSPEPDRKSLNLNNNYLAQSNQGAAYQGTFKTPQIRLREPDKMRASVANSLDDISVKIDGSRHDQSYPNDFQDEQEEKNTRIKIHLDTNSSPQTHKYLHMFVPLFKNYFILKQDAKGLQDSNVSGIGSLKQFSVKFIGSQRRKTQNQKSVKGMTESEDMLEIDMPENSVIAKPSKLKQSTIRKSTIQHKIHKSYNQKVGQFHEKTPMKSKIFGKQKQVTKNDPNFQKINTNLKSKVLAKQPLQKEKQNLLTIPKPEQKLSLSMTQSHILISDPIDQQLQQKQSDKQSIDLSVIPESQNQSLFTQTSTKNRILILIERKYSQKGSIQFDKNLIRNEIMKVMPKNNEEGQGFSWQDLTQKFNQLSKNKQIEVNVLKEERIKKLKQYKEMQLNKIPSKKYSKTKNETKTNEKTKQQDDLTYSRSMIENLPSQKIKSFEDPSAKIQLPNHSSMKENKTTSTNMKTSDSKLGEKQSKFIREQRESSTNKNRQLNKIIQKNKFNQDDEIQNAVKANYKKSSKAIPKSDDQQF